MQRKPTVPGSRGSRRSYGGEGGSPNSLGKRSMSTRVDVSPWHRLWIAMGILTKMQFEVWSLSRSQTTWGVEMPQGRLTRLPMFFFPRFFPLMFDRAISPQAELDLARFLPVLDRASDFLNDRIEESSFGLGRRFSVRLCKLVEYMLQLSLV